MKAAKVLHLKKAQSHSNKAMRLSGERDGIKHPDKAATPENQAIGTEPEPLAWLDKRGRVIEPLFADYFLARHPMRCFHNKLFTVDGMIGDEAILKKEIFALIRDYVKSGVARKTEQLLQAVKLSCAAEPPEIQTDRIHVANGTYFLDDRFTPDKEYCINRLPVAYAPEAAKPGTVKSYAQKQQRHL